MKRRVLIGLVVSLLWGCNSPPPQTHDVLIVTIDTLRADRLGSYGHESAQTPVMDRLAAEGLQFDECWAAVPITLPSHSTIFTGQLPATHGVRNNSTYRLGTTPPTLAEEFSRRGYQTGAAVAAMPLVGTGLERGFDFYQDHWKNVASTDEFLMAERPADDVVDVALEWLGQRDSNQPVFLWVHFFEPHMPYTLVPPFDETFRDEPYDGEIAAADRALGRLLDGFAQSRSHPLLTVVTSDHGEGLGEHGENTHAIFLYQTTLRVPLIVHAPGLVSPGVEPTPVGLVDLAPTLVSLLGWRDHGLKPDGVAVIPEAPPGRKHYAESLFGLETYRWSPLFAVREDNQKVILGNRQLAYDLAADPDELSPLTHLEWIDVAAAGLEEWIQTRPVVEAEPTEGVPSPREVAALEALGYVGGAPSVSTEDLWRQMKILPDPTTKLDDFNDMTKAQEAIQDGRNEAAIALLAPMVVESPQNIWALLLLGDAYLKAERPAEAVETYRAAIEVTPKWLVLHKNLGEAYNELGNSELALASYRLALGIDRRRVDAAIAAARILQAQENFEEGLDVLVAPLARDDLENDERSELLGARARLELQLGRRDASLASVREARDLHDDEGLVALHALVHRRGGQWAENVDLLQGRDDLNPEAMLYLGEAHQMLGQVEAAATQYRACLGAEDTLHLAHNNLAWILAVNHSRPGDALPHVERALDLYDGEPEYHDTYIEVLERLGRQADAGRHASQAAARFPRHAGLQQRAARLGGR